MCNSVAARVVLAGGCLLAIFLTNETTRGECAIDSSANIARVIDVSAPTNIPPPALFPWGDPSFTEDHLNTFPRPPWVLDAGLNGGLWITNDTWYGWQPALTDWHPGLASNRLLIHLDRALLTNNLWIAVAGSAESNATLLAGFFDAQLLNVADPVVLHVAATSGVAWPAMSGVEWPATSGVEWRTNNLDLLHKPAASVIALSTTNGLLRIYYTALLPTSAARPSTSVSAAAPAKRDTVAAAGTSAIDGSVAIARVSAAPPNDGPSNGQPDGPPGGRPPPNSKPPDGPPGGGPPNTPPGLSKGPRTWYVNASKGDDEGRDGSANDCRADSAAGPKRTITAALTNAVPGDILIVAAGTYPGRVKLDGIRLITNGRVVLP